MIRTLSGKLFVLMALWAIIATALVAWYLSTSFRVGYERNLRVLLTANLYNIMGSVSQDEKGRLSGAPDLRDSRYQRPGSGYYWLVKNLSGEGRQASGSLAGRSISPPPGASFNSGFQREFLLTDPSGQELIGIEARAFLGVGDDLYSFVITASRQEADEQVARYVQQLLLVLLLFAVGFILASYFIVKISLAPLNRATESLSDIRAGKTERISGSFPLEVQPLIDETNALIKSNQAVVERARTQVGNLAHSLKTPLAVLLNEADKTKPKTRDLLKQQAGLMRDRIQSYLDRAMISARAGTVTSRTDVAISLERLVRVMRKLNPHLNFDLSLPQDGIGFAGEQQDFEEMIGNLLENAAKFASRSVWVEAGLQEDRLLLSVSDDGPGMTIEEASQAVKRGTRLDESKPGSGLGLSIVSDIAKEYKGCLTFETSPNKGLTASLILPAASSSA